MKEKNSDDRLDNCVKTSNETLWEKMMRLNNILEDHEKLGLIHKKSSERSIEFRNKGNEVFRQKRHNETHYREILSFYSKSMAYAPLGSEELALALSNRSILWLHLHRFDLCMFDIDRALNTTKSPELSNRLQTRKTKCLDVHDQHHGFCTCGKDEGKEPIKTPRPPMLSDYKNSEIPRFSDCKEPELPKFTRSQIIPCAADSVALKSNEKYGRHYIATRDIRPGEVLMSEESPYVSVEFDQIYLICSHCLGFAWIVFPCDHCVFAIYCSDTCKKEAWSQYHDVQCSIIPYLGNDAQSDKDISTSIKLLRMMIILLKTEGLETMLKEFKDAHPASVTSSDRLECGNSKSILSLMSSKKTDNNEDVDNMILTMLSLLVKSTDVLSDRFHHEQNQIEEEKLVPIKTILTNLHEKSKLNSFKFQVAPCVCNDYRMCRRKEDEVLHRGTIFATCSSLFNHSCDPNVGKIFLPGPRIVLFTIRPVRKGEQLFVSYVPTPDMGHKKRQECLQKDYFFTCDCKRCDDKWFGKFKHSSPEVEESKNRLLRIQHDKCFGDLNNCFLRLPKDWHYSEKLLKPVIQMCEYIHNTYTGHEAHDLSQPFRIYIHRYFFYVYGECVDLI